MACNCWCHRGIGQRVVSSRALSCKGYKSFDETSPRDCSICINGDPLNEIRSKVTVSPIRDIRVFQGVYSE